MNVKDIKLELWAIAKAYPTLGGILQKQLPGGGTVGHHWAQLLADLDSDTLENVCYEYANLEVELPSPMDQLPFVIREEVRKRKAKEEARLEQHMRYHTKKPTGISKEGDRRFVIGIRECRRLGRLVRDRKLSAEENAERVEQLCAWQSFKGPEPEYFAHTDIGKR